MKGMVITAKTQTEYKFLIDLLKKLGITSSMVSEEELEDLIINKAKLWLDGGTMFGTEGVGFQRINIACPQKILIQAFTQLKEALKQ